MLNKSLEAVLAAFNIRRVQGGDFVWKNAEGEEFCCWSDFGSGFRNYVPFHDEIKSNPWIKTGLQFALRECKALFIQDPKSQWDAESNMEVEDSVRVLEDLLAL